MITIDYPSVKLLPQVEEAIRFVRDEHSLHLKQRNDAKLAEDKRFESLTWWRKVWFGRNTHQEWIDGFCQAGEDHRTQKRLDTLYRVKNCCEHGESVRIDGDTLNLITVLCGK